MKKHLMTIAVLLLAALLMLPLAACGKSEPAVSVDAQSLLQSLLRQVAFDSELTPAEDSSAVYFPDLPEETKITLYSGSGYYPDELILLELPDEKEASAAMKAVTKHLSELRSQFLSYIPEEVPKIDDAVSRQLGRYIFVAVTSDYHTANDILNHADDPSYTVDGAKPAPEEVPAEPEQQPEPKPETSVEEPETETPVEPEPQEEQTEEPEGYPVLQSQSGTYHAYDTGVVRVDDRAYEEYGYVESAADQYAALVNQTAEALAGQTTVYALPIPTAIGIVFPDDIAARYLNDGDQKAALESILGKLSDQVVGVNCYDNLMRHRDEYLYFHTDYHWNGRGAYYAYEAFCQAKGVEPYTLDQRTLREFDGFLGALYWNNSSEDPVLAANPDTVEAFEPYCQSATMEFTDRNGTVTPWEIISDVSGWSASTKYSTFAGADNPIAVFTTPEVTDGSVCVVVKESFGNALLPFVVDHYSTVYEIDYRYWEGNLAAFAQEKQADDMLFANNLSMIGSNLLIGMLAKNVN